MLNVGFGLGMVTWIRKMDSSKKRMRDPKMDAQQCHWGSQNRTLHDTKMYVDHSKGIPPLASFGTSKHPILMVHLMAIIVIVFYVTLALRSFSHSLLRILLNQIRARTRPLLLFFQRVLIVSDDRGQSLWRPR